MKMRAFETRKRTQLAFSAIRLGTAPLGEIYEILDERTSIATVEQALASGVRLFDTSPHYGAGSPNPASARGFVIPAKRRHGLVPRSAE